MTGFRSMMTMAVSAMAAATLVSPAHASEGGASLYLLGSGGPGAAIMPPLEGVYVDQLTYVYDGSAKGSRQFVLGGNIVAGLDATSVLEATTLLWVPSTNVLGGTMGVGVLFGAGAPFVDVSAVITGPAGGTRSISRHDATLVAIDPLLTVSLGWKLGENLHVQLSSLVNVPIGNYRPDQLANVAFHRWIGDGSLAVTWHDAKAGWDVSAKAGFTFNGTNHYTDYQSGDDFHLEAAVEKIFSPKVSAGILGYYYNQISGDSGAGATLGPNEGKTSALGVTAAYNFLIGKTPATVRGRLLREFDVERRLKGNSIFLTLDLPLSMKMPAHRPE